MAQNDQALLTRLKHSACSSRHWRKFVFVHRAPLSLRLTWTLRRPFGEENVRGYNRSQGTSIRFIGLLLKMICLWR